MNPLTLVKRIQSINAKEADLGISDEASWHAKYKDSAYVFVGGIPYDLTEGDLLAVFAQYGEIVDVNLVRDKATGKSKGFAFVAYEDQRSTILAVDNLNGSQIAGRTIRVDHVSKYKKKEEEDEEAERQKREERGVCRAFQKGECKYGDSCRFSHDEQRAADTGWGPEEDRRSKSAHDKFNNRSGPNKRMDDPPPSRALKENRADDFDKKRSRGKDNIETERKHVEPDLLDSRERRGPEEDRRSKWAHDKLNNRSGLPPNKRTDDQADDFDRKRSRGKDNTETDCKQTNSREKGRQTEYEDDGRDKRTVDRNTSRYEPESKSRDDYEGRQEKRSRNEKETCVADKDRGREREKRSSYTTSDPSPRFKNGKDDDYQRKERRADDDQLRDKRDNENPRFHK